MNKLHLKLCVLMAAMGISLPGWAEDTPCKSLAEACVQEGYYIGGNKVGKGLVEDCVMPIINHKKTIPNVTFSEDQLQQCKAELDKKLQRENVKMNQGTNQE
ncbi:hypothetical protein [Legionella oakridgensis]|uniref:Conjugative transfer protein n=1 Tax=Legionella oakridgensis TaxID=29423 RepID=A0A0W0WXY4_9GAMM|nr:hypothetical protein [Legionella oakridgensis]ETO93418.1 hypothetical protein LOR_25c02090 [Legionella oakridgensis RV-2-2007]KTD37162.1 hypothetical protein Loak_2298 [Legionella oakridgensis]STY20020.1 Uncharacterised protein [Legionella longbeachae]